MVIEALYQIGGIRSVLLYPPNLYFLLAKKALPKIACRSVLICRTAYSNFKVALLTPDLEKALARSITFLELVSRIGLLYANVTSALLLIHLLMLISNMLFNTRPGATYIPAVFPIRTNYVTR